MHNSRPFRLRSFFVAFFCYASCSAMCYCHAQKADGTRLVASLHEIRVKAMQDSKEDEVQIGLLLSNHSDKAYCVLPTQFSIDYSIQYPNGDLDFVAGGKSTVSTAAKDVSDIDVPSVVIDPGRTAMVWVALKTAAKPRGVFGDLDLKYQCSPAYKGNSYRGVILCRDPIHIQGKVVVEFNMYTRRWIIRMKEKSEERKGDILGTERGHSRNGKGTFYFLNVQK